MIHTANQPGNQGERGRNVGGTQGGQGATGVQNITRELQNVNFPVTKQELIQQHGDRQVEIQNGKRVPLREVLNKVQGDRFTSENELRQKLDQNWNEIQRLGGGGGGNR